jgi:hypothetical protein
MEYKLERAQAHIEHLKSTPMTPRELGVITEVTTTVTKKKRIIETRHGSFNLMGLMQKSKAAAVTLDEEEKKANARTEAKRQLEVEAKADLLSYKLCERHCACSGSTCKKGHLWGSC